MAERDNLCSVRDFIERPPPNIVIDKFNQEKRIQTMRQATVKTLYNTRGKGADVVYGGEFITINRNFLYGLGLMAYGIQNLYFNEK